MADRYGAAALAAIRRDFNRHRIAVRNHRAALTEATWLDCERWLGCVEGLNAERHRMIAVWRAVLADVTADLEAEVRARHSGDHPVTLRLLARDMVGVDAAKAVLAEMDAVLGRGE